MKRAWLVAVAGALVLHLRFGVAPVRAETPDALTFFKNYFLTGDYVVGGVGLRGQGVNGLATGSIVMNAVPHGADVAAAFLYWQVVTKDSLGVESGSLPVTFRNRPLRSADGPWGKVLGGGTSPCWSAGGGTGASGGANRTYSYRADVLRLLDVDESTGKFVVNGSHPVQLPDGNGVTALGASLVVVYRDASLPLSAIVMYDGAYTMDQSTEAMAQKIQGFYQPASASARITHIVGSGQANKSERLLFNGSLIATNPFQGVVGASWDNPTFDVTSPVGLTSVTTTADHAGFGTFDCLTWGAMVYRTTVKDSDGDGLLDVWESASAPIVDPTGRALPLLSAMGADPARKDLFIEAGYMQTGGPTTYGGVSQPAHSHLPGHAAIKLLGDTFRDAPEPIALHVDAGNAYPLPAAGEPSAEPYLIRGAAARGGEAIDESATACTRGTTDPPWVCQFSAYPGTVGWKTGFRFLRDEVLSVTPPPGAGVPPPGEDYCEKPGYTCNRRFDRARKDTFRYVLFAHALGIPKSEDPEQPDFHVPRTNTGVGDFPGGDVMVTLGAFADTDGLPVGSPFMQASTLLHELGHTFERRHGGAAREPNCKPTYLSVMNYLYQLRGLPDDGGTPHLDLSREVLPALDETSLFDGPIGGLPYRIGWYAPLAGSYFEGFGRAAARHCDGSDLLPTDVPMVRVDSRTAASPIDWNANGRVEALPLDVNFNGRTTGPDGAPEFLAGSNDWAAAHLNQTGGRRNTGALFVLDDTGRLAVGALSLDSGRGDLGRGDLGRGDLGRGDLGRGDLGRGDLGRGDLGRGDLGRGDLGSLALGRGDLGRGDLGGGDFFTNDPLNPDGELDFETAAGLGKAPPNEFRACVLGVDCADQTQPLHRVLVAWTAPNVGGVTGYMVYRVPGATLLPGVPWTCVGEVDATVGQNAYSLVDASAVSDGAAYTYFAVALYGDGIQSDPSNLVTLTGVNDAPTITSIGDQVIPVGGTTGPLSFTIGDEDPSAVVITAVSSNTAVVPSANIVLGGSGALRTVAVTASNQGGAATITLTATDGARSTSRSFVVTVRPATPVYTFIGFLTPLRIAGSDAAPSSSGTLNLGKAVPVKWRLQVGGTSVSDLRSLRLLEAVPGTPSSSNPTCLPNGGPSLLLFDTVSGRPTGNSTYRFDTNGNHFAFNWDTSAATKMNCYRLRITLADGSAAKVTTIQFR